MKTGAAEMRIRTWGCVGCAIIAMAGCGRFGDSDSAWSPSSWFGGSGKPATLEPEGGYPTSTFDGRQPVAFISGAHWEPLYEGRLLVVTTVPASKGWWDLALVTEQPMPRGRIRPDEFGVLRLRLVGNPPPAGSLAARSTPNPASDTATVGLTLSNETLARVREVVISGAGNAVTLRK
ncbi:hypothetical protein RGQ15_12560 [Paracoccus sp. MBLB3053]|uniref:DUF3576 domain-containing protein n=1 Tax=Paracoccus aurantius TaxID=3073814 RepID=A0ABU2HTL5_9RHOB|nr:hypothetical protein [Paracoccus sp. MBLB3053]MDS9468400.1 hypothetical protein [Paracoccus sp. MBLB3053]